MEVLLVAAIVLLALKLLTIVQHLRWLLTRSDDYLEALRASPGITRLEHALSQGGGYAPFWIENARLDHSADSTAAKSFRFIFSLPLIATALGALVLILAAPATRLVFSLRVSLALAYAALLLLLLSGLAGATLTAMNYALLGSLRPDASAVNSTQQTTPGNSLLLSELRAFFATIVLNVAASACAAFLLARMLKGMHGIDGWKDQSYISAAVDSAYFAVVSFTTVGYGDIYPESPWARIMGLAILLQSLVIVTVLLGLWFFRIAQPTNPNR